MEREKIDEFYTLGCTRCETLHPVVVLMQNPSGGPMYRSIAVFNNADDASMESMSASYVDDATLRPCVMKIRIEIVEIT